MRILAGPLKNISENKYIKTITLFLVIYTFYTVKVEKKFKLAFKSLGIEIIFTNRIRIKAMSLKRKKIKCIQFQLLGDYIIKYNFVEQNYMSESCIHSNLRRDFFCNVLYRK